MKEMLPKKKLLAKLTPESVDLMEDKALFRRGTNDVFGKKFKKNLIRDLKLRKKLVI